MRHWVCNDCADKQPDLYYEATRLKIHGTCEKCGADCPDGVLVPKPEQLRDMEGGLSALTESQDAEYRTSQIVQAIGELQEARDFALKMNKEIGEERRQVERERDAANEAKCEERNRAIRVTRDLNTANDLLRLVERLFIALRDGIDTQEMHCLPLDVSSSWRYVVDKGLEVISAHLNPPQSGTVYVGSTENKEFNEI